jgi:hypothetical protein
MNWIELPYYYISIEKLNLLFLLKMRHQLALILFSCILFLYPALRFWKTLAFVLLPAFLGTSYCLVIDPLINTVLLLGSPMLPTQSLEISTYLQSGPFLTIIFILIILKLLIFVHVPNVLCYVVLSYHSSSSFVCLFVYFSILTCFPPVFACNLSLTLCSVCP